MHVCACVQEDGGLSKTILVLSEGWETPEQGDEVEGAFCQKRTRLWNHCYTYATRLLKHKAPFGWSPEKEHVCLQAGMAVGKDDHLWRGVAVGPTHRA